MMVKKWLLLQILILQLPALAVDGELLSRSGCVFPDYEENRGIERYASAPEYEAAVSDQRFKCERLTYQSVGISVVAFLYRPVHADRKLPLIVFNRGSFVVNGQLPSLVAMFHRLAEAGFVVIAPMLRGSEGAAGKDEFGGPDLEDMKNAVLLAGQLGGIDVKNVFLYGESRGGVMSLMALRDGLPVRAAAVFGAITDLRTQLEADSRAKEALVGIWPDYEQRKESILDARSALRWAERIGTPVLLMHGGADRQVSPLQTLQLATRLQELGKDYGVSIFTGDSHVISQQRIARDRQAVLWFRRYLQ